MHPVTGVTMLHVARYARRLETAGLSPASAARKLAAISSWYAWLARRGHISASPAAASPGPGPARALRQPRPRPRAEVLALINAADTAPGSQRARTAALTAVVLLFAGARLSEVTGADVADLGTSDGRRVLWVTLRPLARTRPAAARPCRSPIDAYLACRARQAPGQALFATRAGRRLFPADVRRSCTASPPGRACPPTRPATWDRA